MDKESLYLRVRKVLDATTHFGDGERIYVAAKVLNIAFSWGASPQGDTHWRAVHDNLLKLADARGGFPGADNPQTTTVASGRVIATANCVSRFEQLMADVRATLEVEQAKSDPDKKLAHFMRYTLHQLEGREEFGQRGLVEKLKDVV